MKYTPGRMLLHLHEHTGQVTRVGLARYLHMDPHTLRNIEQSAIAVSAKHLLRIHETTGLSVAYLRELLGDVSESPYEPPLGTWYHYYWEKEEL